MENKEKFVLIMLIFLCFILIFCNSYYISQLNNKIEQQQQYHIIDAECEEVIPYTQWGRTQLLCYMGDNHNYNSNEKRVIKQWKNDRNREKSSK